jgi:hypothetical protein
MRTLSNNRLSWSSGDWRDQSPQRQKQARCGEGMPVFFLANGVPRSPTSVTRVIWPSSSQDQEIRATGLSMSAESELATLDDGSPAPAKTADEDLFYPCCFRDGSEIRRDTDGEER